jgi:adenine phosphoribosyltransferase
VLWFETLDALGWLDDSDRATQPKIGPTKRTELRSCSVSTELNPWTQAQRGEPSVVVGIESRGLLLGALVAQHLRVGFVEVRKDEHPKDLGVPLLRRTTPPDYRDRGLTPTMRRKRLHPRDRVLLVDDWIDTGAQATAVTNLVADAEATWIGCAVVVVDALTSGVRQRLAVRSILRVHELR